MSRTKVSVVIPVHNTGKYVDECAPSLLGQSMPSDEYEIIYVDDGSTDDTLARLRAIAAEHANVTVLTRPASGWPGAPRNLGMDHARGEYIQFVDHDDSLGPEALERLYDHAKRHDSDIVLGKMSSTMVRPRRVFRHTVDACTIEHDELMQSLSPHKMFRRAFVEEHGLRFPEGPWILEDLKFVSAAYLAAERIGIVADYPCYYWMKRDDGGNNTRHRFDPRYGFWDNARTIVRQIKAATAASDELDALQNRLLYRLYDIEVLSRTREAEILREDPDEQRQRFTAARELAMTEFPVAVRDGLPGISRLRAEFLERDDFAAAVALAERIRTVAVRPEPGALRWVDGQLVSDISLIPVRDDGQPLVLVATGGGYRLDPELLAGVPGVEDGWHVSDPLRHASAELVVKDRDREDWWYPQGDLDVRLQPIGDDRFQIVASGQLRIDPDRLAGGRPMPRGVHDVWAFVQFLGVERMVRLIGDAVPGSTATAPAVIGGRIVTPYWTTSGQLAVDIDQRQRRIGPDTAIAAARNAVRGRHATLPLSFVAAHGDSSTPVDVSVGTTGIDARLVARGESTVLTLPSRVEVSAGRHPVTFAGSSTPVAFAIVRHGRVVRLDGPASRGGRVQRLRDAVTGAR